MLAIKKPSKDLSDYGDAQGDLRFSKSICLRWGWIYLVILSTNSPVDTIEVQIAEGNKASVNIKTGT